MSASSQNNGKKSSNNSVVNTPASTPILNGNVSHNSPPPNNNAPKYGTLVPNRIFVGGISANTTEGELLQLFSNYGPVKAAKIILDRAGVSKGYGFITFENEEDAKRPLIEADNIVLKERKLNIAPAIKKQPFNRTFEASSPPAVNAGNAAQFYYPTAGGPVPFFQGGVAYYPQPPPPTPGDPNTQQPVFQAPAVYQQQTGPQQTPTYPMMYPPQTFFMPQQYSMPMPYDFNYYPNNGATGGGPGPYLLGQGGPPPSQQCAPMQQQQQQQQSSGSPPRSAAAGGNSVAAAVAAAAAAAACFNPLSFSPADPALFYNMPLFSTMEGTPLYASPYDLPPGTYSEDAFSLVDVSTPATCTPPQQQAHTSPPLHHQQHQQIDSTASIVVLNDFDAQQRPHHPLQQLQPLNNNNNNECHNEQTTNTNNNNNNNNNNKANDKLERNSTTPVVSLLAIEQQQEKDYLSMQGGRRQKPANVGPPVVQVVPQLSHFTPYNGHFSTPPFPFSVASVQQMAPHRGGKAKPQHHPAPRKSFDHSSRSSLRTDSNSSAASISVEEEKTLRTNVNTPPPAPYSPMTNQGNYRMAPPSRTCANHYTPQTRNFERRNATYTNRNAMYYNSNNYHHQQQHQRPFHHHHHSDYNSKMLNNNYHSQMHGGNFVQQPPLPPPMRLTHAPHHNQQAQSQQQRGRKPIRRNGGGAGEVGGGDAPPLHPTEGVTDACKKFEGLKM